MRMTDLFHWLTDGRHDELTVFHHAQNRYLPTSLKEIKARIFLLGTNLQQQEAQNIAIYCDDIFYFYLIFYACILSRKNIILLPNNTEGLRNDVRQDYDAFIHFSPETESFYFNDCPILLDDQKPVYCLEKVEFLAQHLLELNIIFFSSGSTGKPKKIIKQFHHLIREVETLEKFFSPGLRDEMVVNSVQHQHLYGFVFAFLWPSLTLRKIYTSRINFSEEIESLSKNTPSFIFISSPTLLSRLGFKHDLSQLICLSAGSALEKPVATWLMHNVKLQVTEIFGSSETGIIAWRNQLVHTHWQCFEQVHIIQNKKGLLHVSSQFFPEKSIKTGDLIQLVSHDQFVLLGRSDRIVKIEGKRLSLTEMEKKLKTHPWIHGCYVLKLYHFRDYIGVFLVLSDIGIQAQLQLSPLDFNQKLKQFLSHWFEKTVLPKAFRYGEKIPLNAQSKIDKLTISLLFSSP
jgi:acyl-coenzyme A synthetase/AMP-(fatty) acid ligase